MTGLQNNVATVALYPRQNPWYRYFALWYFTILIVAWNIVGHMILGFEQSWAQPVIAVLAACGAQFLLEWVDATANGRRPRYAESFTALINFFPPAIITGLACAMLLYPNDRLAPTAFAAVLSIASKVLFRIPMPDGRKHHVFNPSNFGIIATLLIFPWVGQAPPYQFTENVTGFWHWAIPAAVLFTGIIVHAYSTGRLILCIAWVGGFVGQGLIRAALGGNAWYVPLMPMSSAAFILFTLYMVPDPATTPIARRHQILFGLAVAVVYGVLQILHIVFGLFLALTIVAACRGLAIIVHAKFQTRQPIVQLDSPEKSHPWELAAGR